MRLSSSRVSGPFLLSLCASMVPPILQFGHQGPWRTAGVQRAPVSTGVRGDPSREWWPVLETLIFGGSPEAGQSAVPASASGSTRALGMRQMRHCGPAAEARGRLLGQSQAWTDSPHLFPHPPCPKPFCTPCSILLPGPAWISRAPSTVRVKALVLRHVQSVAMWCQQAVGLVLGGIGQELSRDPFHTPRIWVSGEQEGWRHSQLPWAMGPAFQHEPPAAPRPPPCQL